MTYVALCNKVAHDDLWCDMISEVRGTRLYDQLVADENYLSVRLRKEVPPEIRRLTRQVAAEADRDVTQSEALTAAIRFALEHLSEVAAKLPDPSPEER